jgi:hypothetical protein
MCIETYTMLAVRCRAWQLTKDLMHIVAVDELCPQFYLLFYSICRYWWICSLSPSLLHVITKGSSNVSLLYVILSFICRCYQYLVL